jgi:N-acetylglucosaminyldiphosphoundecaprenol N-acetyl-beta-D-mannosaminyltransferase
MLSHYMRRITLGPISCQLYDCSSVLDEISRIIERRTPSQIVTLNALMYNHSLDDTSLARTVSGAAIVVADSVGIAWAARFLNNIAVERTPGIDLINKLCVLAVANGYSLFLLGSRPGVALKSADQLRARFPGIVIAGAQHGFFGINEEPALAASIHAARPDILLVGLEIPRQEKWIAEHREELGVPVIMGVGGSFDVIAGDLKRAPRWMQRAGLEWLFRVVLQPWRLFRIKDLPMFVIHILKLKFRTVAHENKS